MNTSRHNVSLTTHGDKLFIFSNNLIEVLDIGNEETPSISKHQKFVNKNKGKKQARQAAEEQLEAQQPNNKKGKKLNKKEQKELKKQAKLAKQAAQDEEEVP